MTLSVDSPAAQWMCDACSNDNKEYQNKTSQLLTNKHAQRKRSCRASLPLINVDSVHHSATLQIHITRVKNITKLKNILAVTGQQPNCFPAAASKRHFHLERRRRRICARLSATQAETGGSVQRAVALCGSSKALGRRKGGKR